MSSSPANDAPAKGQETVFDVTEEQIARVYAQAYFAVIAKAANTAELVAELDSLVVDLLDAIPDFERTLCSGLVSHEEKVGLLDRVLSRRASTSLLNFLKVLSQHGRLDLLRAVAQATHRIHGEHIGQREVEVRVASELDEPLREELAEKVRQQLGAEPVLNVVVDRTMLGGIVLRVGDTVYDGSVKTRFEIARKAMIARAVETIETKPETFLEDT